jgi:voltage-gated potassium channel Kch
VGTVFLNFTNVTIFRLDLTWFGTSTAQTRIDNIIVPEPTAALLLVAGVLIPLAGRRRGASRAIRASRDSHQARARQLTESVRPLAR